MRSESFASSLSRRQLSSVQDDSTAADDESQNLAFRLAEHPDFELLVNLIIAGNCIALALQDPLLGDHEGRNAPLWWIGQLHGDQWFQKCVVRRVPCAMHYVCRTPTRAGGDDEMIRSPSLATSLSLHAVPDLPHPSPPQHSDMGFNIFFSFEMLLRMMGLGALPPWGVIRYFRRPWNVFDAFMVRERFQTIASCGASIGI